MLLYKKSHDFKQRKLERDVSGQVESVFSILKEVVVSSLPCVGWICLVRGVDAHVYATTHLTQRLTVVDSVCFSQFLLAFPLLFGPSFSFWHVCPVYGEREAVWHKTKTLAVVRLLEFSRFRSFILFPQVHLVAVSR